MFMIRQETGVLEVEFTGQLSPGFIERLRTLVEASGLIERGIVFDLGRVSLGEPEALWELVAFLAELEERSVPVDIRRIAPHLRSLLNLVHAPGFREGDNVS